MFSIWGKYSWAGSFSRCEICLEMWLLWCLRLLYWSVLEKALQLEFRELVLCQGCWLAWGLNLEDEWEGLTTIGFADLCPLSYKIEYSVRLAAKLSIDY